MDEALDTTVSSSLLLYILNVVKLFRVNPVEVVVELAADPSQLKEW